MAPKPPYPIALIIMDGWGIAPPGPANAISQAKTPNFTNFFTNYPHTTLKASGESVGLPPKEMGNTETGHLNIGAGRTVYQDLSKINQSITNGTFFKSPALLNTIKHIKKNKSQLHLMGLISPAGVHSKLQHLIALIRFYQEHEINNIAIHVFTDGRDSSPTSSQIYLDQIQSELNKTEIGFIASVTGRYYAMDRDMRWDRTEKTYRALTEGIGKTAPNYQTAITQSYTNEITDEFIKPTLITNEQGQPKALIKNNDAVIFFNFRIDRPRQLTKAFVLPEFTSETVKPGYHPYQEKQFGKHEPKIIAPTKPFKRNITLHDLMFVTMTEYEKNLPVNGTILPPIQIKMPLSKFVSNLGWTQLKAAESEKERFVTYYFNGMHENPFQRENRLIVPSPKIPTYDLKPEMSANELTNAVIEKMSTQKYDLLVLNYANVDMVGHTGNIKQAIKAIETVDTCIKKLSDFILSQGGICIITADHGNAEEMLNPETREPNTEHSTNPVPFIILTPSSKYHLKLNLKTGTLGDIAPTLLALAGIKTPLEMTGKNLLNN